MFIPRFRHAGGAPGRLSTVAKAAGPKPAPSLITASTGLAQLLLNRFRSEVCTNSAIVGPPLHRACPMCSQWFDMRDLAQVLSTSTMPARLNF
jgi:hypothetical protein